MERSHVEEREFYRVAQSRVIGFRWVLVMLMRVLMLMLRLRLRRRRMLMIMRMLSIPTDSMGIPVNSYGYSNGFL